MSSETTTGGEPHRLLSVLHRNIRLNQWDSLPRTLTQYVDDVGEGSDSSSSSSSSDSESELSSSSFTFTDMSSSRTYGFANDHNHENITNTTSVSVNVRNRGSRENNDSNNSHDSNSNSNFNSNVSEFHSSEDYYPQNTSDDEDEEVEEKGEGRGQGQGQGQDEIQGQGQERLSYHHPPHEIDTSISRRAELEILRRNNRNRNRNNQNRNQNQNRNNIPTNSRKGSTSTRTRTRTRRRSSSKQKQKNNKISSRSRQKKVLPLPLPTPPRPPSLPLLLQKNTIGWTAAHFASLHGAPTLLHWKWILLKVMEEYELYLQTIQNCMQSYNTRRRSSLLSMQDVKDAANAVKDNDKDKASGSGSGDRSRMYMRKRSSMSNTCSNSSNDSNDSDDDDSNEEDSDDDDNVFEYIEGHEHEHRHGCDYDYDQGYDHGEMICADTVNPFFRRTEAGHAATDLFFSKRLHPFPWERVEVKNKAAKLSESIKTILNIVKDRDNDNNSNGTNAHVHAHTHAHDDSNSGDLNSTVHQQQQQQQQTLLVNELKRRIQSKMEEERTRQQQYGANSDDILLQLERERIHERDMESERDRERMEAQVEGQGNHVIVGVDGQSQRRGRSNINSNQSTHMNHTPRRSDNHFRNEDVNEGGDDNHRLLQHIRGEMQRQRQRQRYSSSLTEEMNTDDDGREEVERDMSLHDHIHETNEIHAVALISNHGSDDEDEDGHDGGTRQNDDDNNDDNRITSSLEDIQAHVLSTDGNIDGSGSSSNRPPTFSSSLMENETLDALVDFWHEMELIVMAATQLSLNIDEVDARERGSSSSSISANSSTSARSDESESSASSPRQWSIVHGLAESGCPEEICQLALALYPNQVRQRNHHGNLPLHIAASSHKTSALADGTWQLNEQPYGANASSSPPMLKYMLGIYPEAGMELGAVGRFPINLSIAAGKTWIDGVGDIFAACPNVILNGTIDEPTNLPSFLLAAVASNLRMEITSAITAPSTQAPANNTGYLFQDRESNSQYPARARGRLGPSPGQIVGFQEEMRAKRVASSSIGSMWRFLPAESKARALETAKNDIKMIQITTVFELLRAYPSILVNIGM